MRVPNKLRIKILTGLCLSLLASTVLAAGSSSLTLGGVASEIIGSFDSLTKLITSAAYLAGLGFMVGAIFKFKQHKDTPQQITIGQPIALLVVGASLLFMPTILDVAGTTMFGSSATTAGPTGTIFTSG
jgi:intracellular multiplication protein IcmD